jgi:hypothetical protein
MGDTVTHRELEKISAADVVLDPTVPKKVRIEGQHVTAAKVGTVGWLDRAKNWYKSAIIFLGSALLIANELSPLFDHLPAQDKHYITVGIAAATWLLATLKANEKWVDSGGPAPSAPALPEEPTPEGEQQ